MTLRLQNLDFRYVGPIEPKTDLSGEIIEECPQGKYRNHEGLSLNPHGQGPFCRFSIADG